MGLDEVEAATWGALSRLLGQALDLPAPDRERWLESLPPEARPLVPRLRALLSREGSEGALGSLPRIGTGDMGDDDQAPGLKPGDVVGPHRLVRLLGEGGMGAVWLAERTDGLVQRPVALKLPLGLRAVPGLHERMGREREILAALSHPNIAPLFDAGVAPDGRPWLALEYVDGQPIDAYARSGRLDLRERLALFLQVARAVAHAHGRLVVHRDLKPSNILVTAGGEARLLDFGIAKLLERGKAPETELTRLAGRALTPAYASPEQLRGEAIGVASDVYSLGVVLYQLLAGVGPYRPARESSAALEEAILQSEPLRPSEVAADRAVRRQLRGELDTVILMALHKRPEDRYPTVDAFREDVERWLTGRPVRALPDRLGYRLRKFVGRNRLAVAASGAVLLAVLGGAGSALWQAQVARAEQRRAEAVKEFIASVFREADPYTRKGEALTALDLLRQAEARLEVETAQQPRERVELLRILGRSYTGLFENERAAAVLERALRESAQALPEDDALRLEVEILLAEVQHYRLRPQEARTLLESAVAAMERGGKQRTNQFAAARLLETSFALDRGDWDAAEAAGRAAVELAPQVAPPGDDTEAQGHYMLGLVYGAKQRPDLALQHAEKAYRLQLELHAGDARNPAVVDAQLGFGRALHAMGDVGAAMPHLKEALSNAEKLYGVDGMLTGAYLTHLVRGQVDLGELDEAIDNGRRAVAILAATGSPSQGDQASRAHALGAALLAARRSVEALPHLVQAAEIYAKAGQQRGLVLAWSDQALAMVQLGRLAEAEPLLVRAVEVARRDAPASLHLPLLRLAMLYRLLDQGERTGPLLGEALSAARVRPSRIAVAEVLAELGVSRLDQGDPAGATEPLTEARALLERIQLRPTPLRVDVALRLGRARLGQGEAPEALPLLEEADAFWRGHDAESRWAGEAALWLGKCQLALGGTAEGRRSLARAGRVLARSPLAADGKLVALARAP